VPHDSSDQLKPDATPPDPATPLQGQSHFVWPPKPAAMSGDLLTQPQASLSLASPAHAAPERAWPTAAQWWRAIETTWLPRTSLPLHERLEQAGVEPDTLSAFCMRCGKAVGPFDADDTGCAQCRGTALPWQRLVRLGAYTGVWKRIVREVKFHKQAALGQAAGRLLAQQIQSSGVLDLAPGNQIIVVPVPMNRWRRLARGIDHARIIARACAAELRLGMDEPLGKLYRSEQAFLSATDRRANLRNAMYPRRPAWPLFAVRRTLLASAAAAQGPGVTVILIDDVKTTGSTLKEACRAIRQVWNQSYATPSLARHATSPAEVEETASGMQELEEKGAENRRQGRAGLVLIAAVVAVSERGKV
jgi:predicted amidophosphoribosyltransferase